MIKRLDKRSWRPAHVRTLLELPTERPLFTAITNFFRAAQAGGLESGATGKMPLLPFPHPPHFFFFFLLLLFFFFET